MAAADLGCWCKQRDDGKLKIAHSAEIQATELLQAPHDKPTPCFLFCGTKCQDSAEQLWQRGKGWEGRGMEAALRTTFSGACRNVCQHPRGFFSQGKWQVSMPCPTAALPEQHGAVCTTIALSFGVRTWASAAELLATGHPGRAKLDPEALPLPQSRP